MAPRFPFLHQNCPLGEHEPWDTVLWESDNFVVVPSQGAIVEGWLLLVTKQPVICFGALDASAAAEAEASRSFIAETLQHVYGPIAIWENGAVDMSAPIGCGVDHAHLHFVPTNADLGTGSRRFLDQSVRWEGISDLAALGSIYASGRSYLYLEQPVGTRRVLKHDQVPSQMFRRIIAGTVGKPSEFDWSRFPFVGNVRKTIDRLTEPFHSTSPQSVALAHE